MFIQDIAEYLEDQSIGVVGTNIFVGNQPDSPDNCLVVIATGGNLPDMDIAVLRRPTFQVISRALKSKDAETNLVAVRDKLHAIFGINLDNYYLMRCHAAQEPGSIGKDSKGRYEYSCNFYAQTKPLPAASP